MGPDGIQILLRAEVYLVQNRDRSFALGLDLGQHPLGGCGVFVHVRTGHIHDVDEEIGHHNLFQGSLERLDQSVREAANETDRIGQKDRLAAGQVKLAGGRVEGGEKLVVCQYIGLAQGI